MASKERPTRRGERNKGDSLAELEQILNGAARSKVQTGTSDEAVPEIPPETKKLEEEELGKIEAPVDARIAAEQAPATATVEPGKPKTIPPELKAVFGDEEVPLQTLKMYGGLKNTITKQSVIDRLTADKAKRKRKEEQTEAKPKEPKPRLKGKPGQMRDAEVEPSQIVTPLDKSEVEAGKIDAEMKSFMAEQRVAAEARKGQEAEPMPAVFRSNRIPTLGDVVEEGQTQGIPGSEGTPKENRENFLNVMKLAKEKLGWWSSSEERLIRRSQELDVQAEKIGGMERFFRKMGEEYNKLGWKTKLAVGIGLGVGYGAALSAVSVPGIIGFIGLIGVQRTAGLMTMYLKYEKNSHDEKLGKEKAMAKAMLYTAAMTAGMAYLSKEISDHDLIHRTREWLGNMLGHQTPTPTPEAAAPAPEAPAVPAAAPEVPAPPVSAPEAAIVPPAAEVPQPAAAAAAGEAAAPAAPAATEAPVPVLEIPDVSVEATPGKGYEYMMKRLWEGLQERGLDASQYPEGSDIRQLLDAKPETIDKVGHQIAADERHGFFRPDGTSVRIDKGMEMSFGVRGELHLSNAERDLTWAPKHLPTTPAYHPEAPAAHVETPSVVEDSTAKAESENFAPAEPNNEFPPTTSGAKFSDSAFAVLSSTT